MTPSVERAGSRIVIWLMALGILSILAMLALAVWRDLMKPPPFEYLDQVYQPLNKKVCPGDTLTWQSRFVVRRTPANLILTRNLWDVSRQKTVLDDREPKYFIWLEPERGKVVSPTLTYKLPDNLPLGNYELRTAANAMNSDSSAYRVPFSISVDCFQKAGKP